MRNIKSPDERKSEIILSAKELFIKNGVEKTSVNQIVKNIGVAQGLFYYYFKSKDEVTEAVIDSVLDECEKQIQKITKHPDNNFFSYVRKFVLTFSDMHDTLCIKLGYTTLKSSLKFKIHQQIVKQLVEDTKELLQMGIKQGFVKMEYPELMHRLVIGGLWDLIEEGVSDTNTLLILAEQAFGLPKNCLHIPPKNFEIVNI